MSLKNVKNDFETFLFTIRGKGFPIIWKFEGENIFYHMRSFKKSNQLTRGKWGCFARKPRKAAFGTWKMQDSAGRWRQFRRLNFVFLPILLGVDWSRDHEDCYSSNWNIGFQCIPHLPKKRIPSRMWSKYIEDWREKNVLHFPGYRWRGFLKVNSYAQRDGNWVFHSKKKPSLGYWPYKYKSREVHKLNLLSTTYQVWVCVLERSQLVGQIWLRLVCWKLRERSFVITQMK